MAMTDKKDDEKEKVAGLKDVEPGSDADETPVAQPGESPPDPNVKQIKA